MFVGLIISFAVPWFIICYYFNYYDLFLLPDKWLICFICICLSLLSYLCHPHMCYGLHVFVSANRYFDLYMYDAVHVLYCTCIVVGTQYGFLPLCVIFHFVVSHLLYLFADCLSYSWLYMFMCKLINSWVPLVFNDLLIY